MSSLDLPSPPRWQTDVDSVTNVLTPGQTLWKVLVGSEGNGAWGHGLLCRGHCSPPASTLVIPQTCACVCMVRCFTSVGVSAWSCASLSAVRLRVSTHSQTPVQASKDDFEEGDIRDGWIYPGKKKTPKEGRSIIHAY